MGLALIPVE